MNAGQDRAQSEQVPQGFLIAAGLLVALTISLIAGVRLFGGENGAISVAGAVATRDLRFVDEPGGGVGVFAVPEGRRIVTVDPGSNGFLRGTLRALVRERRLNGAGDAEPFRLMRLADGAVVLEDLATGRRLHLGAFGSTNSAVFAGLLPTSGNKPQ
ncbi:MULTISPECIES: photosynthetic complex assembly protein PuhC [Rhodomicrobium]|uniref:photosynthetic complex assembly protein PuhC n=1 Tax=Rhodomicrobium TaxID=1068 RepID=UPI000B4ABE5C|nr:MULTISPECIES: photosynthetic complex assembly protein PuhC [Rhodomicrobium]